MQCLAYTQSERGQDPTRPELYYLYNDYVREISYGKKTLFKHATSRLYKLPEENQENWQRVTTWRTECQSTLDKAIAVKSAVQVDRKEGTLTVLESE